MIWKDSCGKIFLIVLCPLILLYCICMFVLPFVEGGWLYTHAVWMDWQTLNAGILALTGAVMTVFIIRKQIQSTEKQAEKHRHAQQRAVNTVLTFTLEGIRDYSEKCISVAAKELKDNDCGEPDQTTDRPSLNPDVTKIIHNAIVYAKDDKEARFFGLIPRWAQVQRDRFEAFLSDGRCNRPSKHEIQNAIFDAILLSALASAVLLYVRDGTELPDKLSRDYLEYYMESITKQDPGLDIDLKGFDKDSHWKCFDDIITGWYDNKGNTGSKRRRYYT